MSKRENLFMWAVFTLCVFIRLFPLIFHYCPLQDDYIQYHVYSLFENSFTDFLIPNGILRSRPLAGIFDFFVWSNFWHNMTVALWIISAMHIASAVMLKQIFDDMNIQLNCAFFVVYLLLPISFEATYWISASSRIIVSLFFGVSASYLAVLYLNHSKSYLKSIVFVLFLSSLLFYEQTAIINCVLFLFVLLQHKNAVKRLIVPFACAIIITAAYYLYTIPVNRIPDNPDSFPIFLKRFVICVCNLFTHDSFGFFSKGLQMFSQYLSSGNLLYISVCILSIALSVLFGVLTVNCRAKNNVKTNLTLIILGILIIVLSFTPYIIIRSTYLPYRSAFTAVIGLSFISAGIFDMMRTDNKVKASVISLFSIICIFGNIYQADTMRQVAKKDAELIEEIAAKVTQSSDKELEIYGYQPLYIELPDFYKSRVYNITSSDWAISGAVRSYLSDTEIKIHLSDGNF